MPSRFSHCLAVLESRAVLKVSGQDTLTFLQGLITQDTHLLAPSAAPPILAAMLSPQGRCMYDLIIHRSATPDLQVLLDTKASDRDQLLANLMRFKLRKAVSIADVSSDLCVAAYFEEPRRCEHDTGTSGASTSGTGDAPPLNLPRDPRLSALGWRGIVLRADADAAVASAAEGGACGHSDRGAAAEMYTQLRHKLGVAEGEEIPKGTAIPLEYNFDLLHGVSFEKGCYMGQELVARTHFRGLVRKRVVPIELPAGCMPAVDADIVVSGTTTSVGKVKAASGTFGLALLRLAQVADALDGKLTLELKGSHHRITPQVPSWWPWQQLLAEIRPADLES